ncbi:MAG: hypothetical protein RR054_02555 [Clostridia bacterium]
MKVTNINDIKKQIEILDNLSNKNKNCLILLAEEMLSMSVSLLGENEGDFYIEKINGTYYLNLQILAKVDEYAKDELIGVSTLKKNNYKETISDKILSMLESFVNASGQATFSAFGMNDIYNGYAPAWTLSSYLNTIPADEETSTWDGLEKSIIANFSDDVIIGVKRKMVQMTVKKTFDK